MTALRSPRPALRAACTLALAAAAAAGAEIRTVSPGELDREVEAAGACPTFSWGAVPGADAYELAVFALDARGEPELVLRRVVEASASSWTPARAECLAPGVSYAWSIAPLAPAGREAESSAPRLFRVPGMPSDQEVADALALLGRWRDGGGTTGSRAHAPARVVLAPRAGEGPRGGGTVAAVRGTFDGTSGAGVAGLATAADGVVAGVRGETASISGAGVVGVSTATANFPNGVRGEISAALGAGVFGRSSATSGTGIAVRGDTYSDQGTGLYGMNWNTSGPYARGVFGGTSSPNAAGISGAAWGAGGTGVSGSSGAASAGTGVAGTAAGTSGIGVDGYAYATSGQSIGVRSWVTSPEGRGVWAYLPATTGNARGFVATVRGPQSIGVEATSEAATGSGYGVRGVSYSSSGRGVYGNAPSTATAWAGYFSGNVRVTGTLTGPTFQSRIDHPLDPEHKYLHHAAVESSDPKTVYDGVVRLDVQGSAWVELPAWFEALNRDFRYQLTPIGEPAVLWIGRGVEAGRFQIRGGAGVEVSWQVTGVRSDRFAERWRLPVEQEKPADEQGTYLHPDLWGVAPERGLEWRLEEPLRRLRESDRDALEAEGDRPGWARFHAELPPPEPPRDPR